MAVLHMLDALLDPDNDLDMDFDEDGDGMLGLLILLRWSVI